MPSHTKKEREKKKKEKSKAPKLPFGRQSGHKNTNGAMKRQRK